MLIMFKKTHTDLETIQSLFPMNVVFSLWTDVEYFLCSNEKYYGIKEH